MKRVSGINCIRKVEVTRRDIGVNSAGNVHGLWESIYLFIFYFFKEIQTYNFILMGYVIMRG